jgi:hypothetical protein
MRVCVPGDGTKTNKRTRTPSPITIGQIEELVHKTAKVDEPAAADTRDLSIARYYEAQIKRTEAESDRTGQPELHNRLIAMSNNTMLSDDRRQTATEKAFDLLINEVDNTTPRHPPFQSRRPPFQSPCTPIPNLNDGRGVHFALNANYEREVHENKISYMIHL